MKNIRTILYVILKNGVWYRITLESILIIMIPELLNPSFSFAYKAYVHERITFEAINQNKDNYNKLMKNIGLADGIGQNLSGRGVKTIQNWMQHGSKWEDNIALVGDWRFPEFGNNGILYCHFYNPLFDLGYYDTLVDGTIDVKGESILYRMNDYVGGASGYLDWFDHNEWSYQMARDLYYAALTGDSTKHGYWFMLDIFKSGWSGWAYENNMIMGKKDISHEEKEQFFAWTFQALGHIIHLIQDVSVPGHTRNDLHADGTISWAIPGLNSEPYEEWTGKNYEKNKQLMNYNGYGSGPWDLWRNYEGIPAQNAFIDTYPHPEGSLEPDPIIQSDDLDQGLAQYSYANFLSEDSVSIDNPLGHDLSNLSLGDFEDAILVESVQIESKQKSMLYVKNDITNIDHFALVRLSWLIKEMVAFGPENTDITTLYYTVKDPLVSGDYASKLVPRAVGYSAGFFNYFFRGTIEITAPDNFVYSIIDGSEPHEFTQIKAKVRNTTPNEAVQTGTLVAVAKYRERIDYREDLYTDPPKEWSREETWSYSVSEPIEIDALSSDTAQSFDFDFSDDPIPAGVTDLYIQVVFKGTLGNEQDIAVAVGMKDLTEPTHICTWNSTDRVYINDESLTGKPYGVLRTGQQIRENSDLFQAATTAGVYIDPHPMTRELGFYPLDGSFNTYQVTFNDMPAGRYGKIVILTDTLSFNMRMRSVSSVPEKNDEAAFPVSAAINQDESGGEFQNTEIQVFRGINQHLWSAFAWYLGSTEGIDTAAWPLPTSIEPYPATTINP